MKYAILESHPPHVGVILVTDDPISDLHEIVLSEFSWSSCGSKQFVTWARNKENPSDFYWGHYYDSFEEALKDFIERAAGYNEIIDKKR